MPRKVRIPNAPVGLERLKLAFFIESLREVLGLQPLGVALVLKEPGHSNRRRRASSTEKFFVVPFSFRNARRTAHKSSY